MAPASARLRERSAFSTLRPALSEVYSISSLSVWPTARPSSTRNAETVIFEDGRVITADVEAAGDRLNELGWNGRELQLVSSLPRRYAFSGGGDWRAGSGTGKSKPRKRRRRRG